MRLSGAFIEVFKVTNLGEEGPDPPAEAEVKIAETRDDIDIGIDVGEASGRAHGERTVQRMPVSATQSFTFQGFTVDDMANLTTLGVLDSGKLRPWSKAKHEALRMKVYARDGDASPAQSILLEDVELIISNLSWPQDDYAVFDAEAWINGEITLEALE